jgi:monovalent cation:H+ antiporter-2, CPA2 family
LRLPKHPLLFYKLITQFYYFDHNTDCIQQFLDRASVFPTSGKYVDPVPNICFLFCTVYQAFCETPVLENNKLQKLDISQKLANNGTMQPLAPLIKDLAVILGIASLVTLLFQKIKQPVVLGYLLSGVIVGPYVPPYDLVSDVPSLHTLSELGVIFLMFSLGLDFSFHKLKRVGTPAILTGLVEVILVLAIGIGLGKILAWPTYDCIFLGAALSISSTTIIIKAMEELGLKHKHFAELVFGILIVEDLLAILLLAGLSIVVGTHVMLSATLVDSAIKLFIVVGSWFLVGYFLIPSLIRKLVDVANQETLTIVSVALCLLLVCIAAYFGYSSALGAFIMGSILAETDLIQFIEQYMRPIRDIFAAVFFISVGMIIVPSVIIDHIGIVLLISVVTILAKIVTTTTGALATGQTLTTAVRTGFSMAQIGEFSFIIAGLGLLLGVTQTTLFPIIIAVSAVTTFATPYLIKSSALVSLQLEKNLPISLKALLGRYTILIHRYLMLRKKRIIYSQYIARLLINGVMVAIIFTLSEKWIFPKIIAWVPITYWVNILSCLIALILASPFIWGMIFAYKIFPYHYHATIKPIIALGWIFALTVITTLAITYFHTWSITLLLGLLAFVLFRLLHTPLKTFYPWLEKRFLANIKTPTLQESSNDELLAWGINLKGTDIRSNYYFINKTLQELNLYQQYGIHVIALYRGSKIILSPEHHEKIRLYDKLFILGSDEQIDAFSQHLQTPIYHEALELFNHFELKTFLLDKTHPFIGLTLEEAMKKNNLQGIILGLERKGVRKINPHKGTILKTDDLLILLLDKSI